MLVLDRDGSPRSYIELIYNKGFCGLPRLQTQHFPADRVSHENPNRTCQHPGVAQGLHYIRNILWTSSFQVIFIE